MAKLETFNGPGGTVYTQIAKTKVGRVGVAKIYGGTFRVRLEPSSDDVVKKVAEKLSGWKMPEQKNRRFSTVADGAAMEKAVKLAKSVIGSTTKMTGKKALAA